MLIVMNPHLVTTEGQRIWIDYRGLVQMPEASDEVGLVLIQNSEADRVKAPEKLSLVSGTVMGFGCG